MYAVVVFLITLYNTRRNADLFKVGTKLTPAEMEVTSEVELIIQLYEFKVGTN
jgi:hypothetical protein